MSERNQSINIQDKSFDQIHTILEDELEKKLSFSTDTTKLGNSLIRINYFDKNIDKQLQKENRITILQEQDKRVYVQIAGVLDDDQVKQLWRRLESFLNTSDDSIDIIEELEAKDEKLINELEIEELEETDEKIINNLEGSDESEDSIEILEVLPSKDEIIDEIKNQLENRGYILEMEDVETFINNFIEKYDRLPIPSELNSIVKGYILMIQEESKIDTENAEPIIEVPQGEVPQEVVPSEELQQEVMPQDELTQELYSLEELKQEEVPQEEFPRNIFEDVVLSKVEIARRRRCPNCGNEGLIREVDDKTKILMDYPKIYAKKKICTKCSYEWHVE